MRKINLLVLWAGSAALTMTAPIIFGAAPASAQVAAEYGTTVSEGAGEADTIGMSSSTLTPPASRPNPVSEGGGASATVEVSNNGPRVDDSSDNDHEDAHDANSGDEWSTYR